MKEPKDLAEIFIGVENCKKIRKELKKRGVSKDVPFSNGTQYGVWLEKNCNHCLNNSNCKYLNEIDMSRFDDCKVTEETFKACFSKFDEFKCSKSRYKSNYVYGRRLVLGDEEQINFIYN